AANPPDDRPDRIPAPRPPGQAARRPQGSAHAGARRGPVPRRGLHFDLDPRQPRKPAALATGVHGDGNTRSVRREVRPRRTVLLLPRREPVPPPPPGVRLR